MYSNLPHTDIDEAIQSRWPSAVKSKLKSAGGKVKVWIVQWARRIGLGAKELVRYLRWLAKHQEELYIVSIAVAEVGVTVALVVAAVGASHVALSYRLLDLLWQFLSHHAKRFMTFTFLACFTYVQTPISALPNVCPSSTRSTVTFADLTPPHQFLGQLSCRGILRRTAAGLVISTASRSGQMESTCISLAHLLRTHYNAPTKPIATPNHALPLPTHPQTHHPSPRHPSRPRCAPPP